MKLRAVFAFLALVSAERERFINHKVLSIQPSTQEQVDLLRQLQDDPEFQTLDVWTAPSLQRPMDVRVEPNQFGNLNVFLKQNNIEFTIKHNNLEELVEEELQQIESMIMMTGGCDPITNYCTYDTIVSYLNTLASQYPSNIQLTSIGTTYEEREIYSVKVAEDLNSTKTEVWIEAGTHAREWIAVASAINLIEKLVNGSNTSDAMLAKYDWNIVPVHNPDGYEYTHTTYRFHRKNRQPHNKKGCSSNLGTDTNRNWDVDFKGASTSPVCSSDVFPGKQACDTMECQALRYAVNSNITNVKAFFAIHSYSELFLLPFAYTSTKPSSYNSLLAVAEIMMDALSTVRGTTYTIGTPPDILYTASGTSSDYFFLQNVNYTYTYELSPTSSTPGFALGPEFIPDVSEEVFVSLAAFADLNL